MDFGLWGNAALTAYSVVLAALCVFGLHRYFLVLTYFRVRRQRPIPLSRYSELPRVTVQLPMYNERYVARRIIEQACRIDYPRDRLQIQVLDDSTDQTAEIARQTVERLRAAGHDIVYIHRSDRTGYKAGALANGLNSATGEFIAIFDADFLPPEQVLRETVHFFTDQKVGMVQCRWDHLNRGSSLLTHAQAILLDGHFLIEHTARNRSGRFMSFNGTAGIWRRSAIQDAGGWQHDTLTEDLDLSYRAQLQGWRFVFLPDLTAPAELPPEMNAFKAQQHRWTKGGAQTCVKLLRDVFRRGPDWRVKLEACFHLSSWAVYVLMVLLSVLIGPALIAKLVVPGQQPSWRLAVDFCMFVIGTGSALSFYVVSQRELARSWLEILWHIPALMAIGIGIAFNNAVAAIEGVIFRAGEFVRTPKFGDQAADGVAVKASLARVRSRGAWKAWAELSLAAYLLACLCSLFFFDHWVQRVSAAIPFLGLFIFGYAYVALHSFGALRFSRRPPAQAAAPDPALV